jgi:hypothetical protein
MNFIIEADHFIFASNTPGNGTGPSKFCFLIKPVAGKKWIRILIQDTCVQKLDRGDLGQRWDDFGMGAWGNGFNAKAQSREAATEISRGQRPRLNIHK